MDLCRLHRYHHSWSNAAEESFSQKLSHIFLSAQTDECNRRWHVHRQWIDPSGSIDAERWIPDQLDQLEEEKATICDEEKKADAEQLNHHAKILRPCQLLVHSTFLIGDSKQQEHVEDEHEKDENESMGDLFVHR